MNSITHLSCFHYMVKDKVNPGLCVVSHQVEKGSGETVKMYMDCILYTLYCI